MELKFHNGLSGKGTMPYGVLHVLHVLPTHICRHFTTTILGLPRLEWFRLSLGHKSRNLNILTLS